MSPSGLTGCSPVPRRAVGVVTGHLFKAMRESVPLTQEQAAAALGVDKATVQGWESGRRPLTSTRAGTLRAATRTLLALGAEPRYLTFLGESLDADGLISYALEPSADVTPAAHPLSHWVMTRDLSHALTWPLTGEWPTALPPRPTPRARGPVAAAPVLSASERTAFFTHMRRAAEQASEAGVTGALLRRQALYICAHDSAPDTGAWLAHMRRSTLHGDRWTPYWADARSLATSLARHGDPDPLRHFIERALSTEEGETANLRYWAYWLGLDRTLCTSDTFMTAPEGVNALDGVGLLRNLTARLGPHLRAIDLNVHTVWALLKARPGVLHAADRELTGRLRTAVIRLLDEPDTHGTTRRKLESVQYGLSLQP